MRVSRLSRARRPGVLARTTSLLFRLAAVFAVCAVALRSAGAEVSYPTFTLAQLQQDFDQFQRIATTQHPRLYTDQVALTAGFVSQRALLRTGMNELEFFRVLSPLVSRLNCGHTSLELSSGTQTRTSGQCPVLPLAIKIIDGRLYVSDATAANAFLIGAEILAINGWPAQEVIQRLYDNLPADGTNTTLKGQRLSGGYSFSSALYTYIETADTYLITYRSPLTRSSVTVSVPSVPASELPALRQTGRNLVDGIGWSEFGDDYALLAVTTFNFYDAAGHTRFYAFVDRFFGEVAARRSPCVILDLRGNGGGDPYVGAYLVAHFLRQPQPYFAATTPYYPELKVPQAVPTDGFTGPAYFLTNGGCFSTTGHVVSLLKFYGLGQFIGEETGGSFACTAATQTTSLTNTQLRFQYSTLAFATAVSGLTPGRGIMPDYEVIPTVEDRLAGRDPEKEFALAFLRHAQIRPAIAVAPTAHLIAPGSTAVLDVSATGSALRYQWWHDAVPIDGATSRLLVLNQCASAEAGEYSVVVSNPAGIETSAAARVEVRGSNDPSRVANMSVRTGSGPGDQTLIVGFALDATGTEGTTDILVRGIGPGLVPFAVPNVLVDPRLELFDQASSTLTGVNDDWAGNPVLGATARRVGAFPLTDPMSRDAVLVATLRAAAYSAHLIGNGGGTGTVLAELYDAAPADAPRTTPRLVNVSARAQVDESNPLILGFVLAGSAARTVLIRGIGPGLPAIAGATALTDPKLQLFRHENGAAIALTANDDWTGAPQIAAMARQSGAFALPDPASKDAVALVTLEPGVYSVHVGVGGGTAGIALAEAYVIR